MFLSFLAPLALSAPAPSQPVDIRAVLVELTIEASGVSRACETIESSGSELIDGMACLLVASKGVEVPSEVLPPQGSSATIKWKQRAAMVEFSDGSSKLAIPPERMMRRAFLRKYPDGQRGAMLVESLDGKGGPRTCAFFAPRMVSRFDAATCRRVLSVEEQATESTVGENRRVLLWTNAVVAAGDL